jgi:hypothetical protein
VTRRTIFWLAALAAVGTAVYFYAGRGQPAPESGSGAWPPLLKSVGTEFEYVFYADAAAVRDSPLFSRLLASLPAPEESPDYKAFVAATGFDYSRDLDRLAVWTRRAPDRLQLFALAEGRFDRERITRYALRTGRSVHQAGHQVLLVPAENATRTIALAFVADHRVALADGPDLTPALQEAAASAPEQRERIARLAGSPVFLLGRVPAGNAASAPGGWRSDQLDRLLAGIRWASAAARPEGQRLIVVIEGECDSAMNARQLVLLLEGLRLVARATLNDPKTRRQLDLSALLFLEALVRAEDLTRDDSRVRLVLRLTPEIFAVPNSPAANPKTRCRAQ